MLTRCVLVLLIAVSAFAPSYLCAAEDNWRVSITAVGGQGGAHGPAMQLGVHPTAIDAGRAFDGTDLEAQYIADFPQMGRWLTATIPGDARTWTKDIMSPAGPQAYPDSTKRWEFRIGALSHASSDSIRLDLATFRADGLPPSMTAGISVAYRLVMVDNKGMPGAPANGKAWNLPIPTTHPANHEWVSYWTLPQTDWLPILRLSSPTHEAMISEGYAMRFEQYAVSLADQAIPEPAGLVALAIGIAGLIGSAMRRRK